jgi:uncharacterized membrane protein
MYVCAVLFLLHLLSVFFSEHQRERTEKDLTLTVKNERKIMQTSIKDLLQMYGFICLETSCEVHSSTIMQSYYSQIAGKAAALVK